MIGTRLFPGLGDKRVFDNKVTIYQSTQEYSVPLAPVVFTEGPQFVRAVPGRQPRILCVDDHADICRLVATLLDGFQVIEAQSVRDAMQKAQQEEFDLFLLDYFLPDGNGVELCRSIRKIDSQTPIIFVTVARPLTKLDGASIGFQGVIEKHHIADQLPAMIARLLPA